MSSLDLRSAVLSELIREDWDKARRYAVDALKSSDPPTDREFARLVAILLEGRKPGKKGLGRGVPREFYKISAIIKQRLDAGDNSTRAKDFAVGGRCSKSTVDRVWAEMRARSEACDLDEADIPAEPRQ